MDGPLSGFQTPQTPLSADTARRLIMAQDSLIASILTPAYLGASDRVDAQEEMLAGAVAPLVSQAGSVVASHNAQLADIANRCRTEARARVGTQQAILDSLKRLVMDAPPGPALMPFKPQPGAIDIGEAFAEDADDIPDRFGLAPEEPDRPVPPPGYLLIILPGGGYAFQPAPGSGLPAIAPPPQAPKPGPGRAKPSPPVGAKPGMPGAGKARPKVPPRLDAPGQGKDKPPRQLTQKEREKIRKETYKGLRTTLLEADKLKTTPRQPGYSQFPDQPGGPGAPESSPEEPLPEEPLPEEPLPGAPEVPPPLPPDRPAGFGMIAVPEPKVEINVPITPPEEANPPGFITIDPTPQPAPGFPDVVMSRDIEVAAAGEDVEGEKEDDGPKVVIEIPKAKAIGNCSWQPLTEEFCAALPKLLEKLGNVGAELSKGLLTIQKVMNGLRRINAAIAAARGQMPQIPWGMFAGFQPVSWTKKLSDLIPKELIPDDWRRDALWALYLARAVLRMLSDATLNLSPGVGISLSIRYSLEEYVGVVQYIINWVCPLTITGQPDLIGLYLSGRITHDQYVCLMATQGVPSLTAEELAMAGRTRLDGRAEVRDWMRFRQGKDVLDLRLRALGWTEDDERARLIRSQEYIPPPGELIMFAVRDVFDARKLGRDVMLAEYAQQTGLKELFSAQGIGRFSIRTEDHRDLTYDAGEAHWLAHYHNAAPGQAFEMLHRLRPNRVDRYAQTDAAGKRVIPTPVLIDDVRALLKEDDLNPVWRDRLAAISYHRIGRVDVRRMYDQGVFGPPQGMAGFKRVPGKAPEATGPAEKELVESYQDAGYNRDDAGKLAEMSAGMLDKSRMAAQRSRAVSLACKLFQLGGADRETTLRAMEKAGLTRQQAEAEMAICETADAITTIKKVMATIRKLYLRGEYSRDVAADQLAQAGISPERVDTVIRRWQLELAAVDKKATASEMCAWYGAGLMTLAEMSTRLTRLGYLPADVRRIIAHCVQGWAAKAAKERAARTRAQEKARQQAAKVSLATAKKADQARAKTLAKKLAKRTDAQLVKWWRLKLISEAIIRETMRVRGVDVDDINRWVRANLVPEKAKEKPRG